MLTMGFEVKISEKAIAFIGTKGYDPKYGARPLARSIQKFIEDPLAEEIVAGKASAGDTIKFDAKKDSKKLILKIVQEKKDFVYRYNFDWWSNRTPPWTQRKTVKTKAEVKAFPCDNNASEKKSVKKLQEINIFKHIPFKY